ncbi:unnamed protein product [Rotaria sordida]|uniref:Uncharacterized protein n=1 Tax=Rotaria sordida TaxID=392033 RepID=A0A819FDH2_9BILA|nr:unnamed protein product [Rotaria sordida]CAF3865805.1 unnamed protein product [Rotaria sordida]
MLTILFLFSIFHISLSDKWYSKSQCTQKEFANHMDINCNSNEFILIGWSHYGTKKLVDRINSSSSICEPSEKDCIMDYTHKIAELCNGVSKCEVILTQQFIHKCSDEATYLFISYQCIQNSTIIDICSERSITSLNGVNLISPMFPNEYPNNINCTCSIESKKKSNVIIDVESLSFNLQDNDNLLSFSGTIPFGASLLTVKNQFNLKFQTDETLSQSGFWIRLYGYEQCYNDEYILGSKCIKIFSKKQTWKLAKEKCLSIDSNLIRLHDIIQEKKLAYFILTNNEQQQLTSFWISNEKDNYDIHSWWPWRSSSTTGKCVLRTQDGWIKRPCNEEQAFICERDMNRQSIPLTVHCGNAQSTTILSTKRTTTTVITTTTTTTTMIPSTQRTTISFIHQENISLKNIEENFVLQQSSSTINNKVQKIPTNFIDSNILAAILTGIAIVIFSVNIVVCCVCKKRVQDQSKCKTQNDSNTSFIHEELQHSLMQHLYHEQTNTISSTSTSSSSSKHSQSKSNDTTTTISINPFQLCSSMYPSNSSQSNNISTTLCYRNPHVGSDVVDYHVYETIPSENPIYTFCTSHSAFKPVVQSNTHTIRPFLPRTNILHHHPCSLQQSYDTMSSIPSNATVVMPVCCHHYSSQCSTGTLRQHVLPSSTQIATEEQIYTRSESIV